MSSLNRWLQQNSKNSFEQQCQQLANLLRVKEQALETTSHELKVKTAAMQMLEQRVMSSETQFSSAQRELIARNEQLKTLEAELAIQSRRLADLETEGSAAQQQVSELKSIIATQGDELRAGQQGREVLKEEIRVLREHIVQLNEGLSDRDHLRAQMVKFESAHDRVHLLEIELSDREAAHRRRIQQFEQILAERDQRIGEFDASAAAQVDALRGAQQARQTAEQAREVLKEENRVLREQVTQLNEGLPARERLRAQVKELESMRSRVHELEVELSDREAAHRGTIQQLEQSIAERDRRISEFDSFAAAQADEVRDTLETCRTAEQVREVQKEEIRVLREQIVQLNEGLADRDRLRAQVKKLESAQDRVHQLEVELSDREAAHRSTIQQLEQSIAERDQQIGEFGASALTHADALHGAQQACQTAEQTQEVLKEEIRVLRDQIAQLNEGLADRDRLRAQVKKLESAQARVHQLEVELSDREAAHRGTIQQLEQSIAERDRRISEFDSFAAAQADEVRDTLETYRTAEQAREVQKEEIRVLREQIAQLNKDLTGRDRLRVQAEKLESTQARVHQLEVELSDREAAHRSTIKQLEQSIAERDRRISKLDANVVAQADKLHGAQQACQTAEQAQEVLKEEIRVLRDHITQLNEGLADRDQLRAQVKKLESARDRVHQLEVELSDREAAHRSTIQQLEQSIAERDRRVSEFDSFAAAQANEVQDALEACRTAEQAREVQKEEIRVLREHIAQLNEGLADRDRLRAQVKKLESTQARVHQLEVELSDREAAHRSTIQQLEQSIAERDRRINEFDASAVAQADKVQDALEACRTAEQAREVQKEEIRVLREQIAQLNKDLAGRDRLRAQVEKLESTQARVHQLEVELSDREAAHRSTIKQLEQSIAKRDRRIDELVPITHLLHEKEATIKEWERTHARTVRALEIETAKLQESCASQDQLQARHQLDERQLQERDAQIANLQRELQDLHAERQALSKQVQRIPEKDEHIERLQKRLKDLRATLRPTPSSAPTSARQPRPNGAGPQAPVGPPKVNKPVPADDLKKISGIGPVFADTLQKLGTRTFIQIARWKPDDIEKIAKKLETDPERIKREKWIADAKKQHYQKYGERL
jgi:predicted flap endonuclease-1-like 5' DNA nuclease